MATKHLRAFCQTLLPRTFSDVQPFIYVQYSFVLFTNIA